MASMYAARVRLAPAPWAAAANTLTMPHAYIATGYSAFDSLPLLRGRGSLVVFSYVSRQAASWAGSGTFERHSAKRCDVMASAPSKDRGMAWTSKSLVMPPNSETRYRGCQTWLSAVCTHC